MGQTQESFIEQQKPETALSIKTRLVLEAIVEKENITASDEQVDARLTEMANAYKMELDMFKTMLSEPYIDDIKKDVAVHNAVDMLVAEAVLKEAAKPAKAKKDKDAENTESEKAE